MKKTMRAITAVIAILAVSAAWANPVAIPVKEGLLLDKEGTTHEVGEGAYFNREALDQIISDFTSLTKNNAQLTMSLKLANDKIAQCDATVPGFPTWAGVLVSALLTVASGVVAFFAARELTGAK